VSVPAGSLAISTPYTTENPFGLGTLLLDPEGETLTASAQFGTGPEGGITITDTRPGSSGWVASAQTTDFIGPIGDPTSIDGNGLSFSAVTPSYFLGNNLTAGSVTTNPIDHFRTAKKTFAKTSAGPGTVDISGLFQLLAPTSTLPGDYTATITFTVV
jgi:hypothetical protein